MKPPSSQADLTSRSRDDSRAIPASASNPSSAPGCRLRILVVDDEPAIRDVLTAYLQEHNHHAVSASNGTEALQIFEQGGWDLVMTDGLMPEMSGTELAREIKKRDPALPIFLVSGSSEMLHQAAGETSPIDCVIRKPFTRDALAAALAQVASHPKSST